MFQSENQIIARLQAPFLPDEHEYMERFKLIYLRESAINQRLTKVLGRSGWSFSLVGTPNIFNGGIGGEDQMVTQAARLTIRIPMMYMGELTWTECYYENVGGDKLLNLGVGLAERMMNTVKSATTDALKRCAASMGVGLYLKELEKNSTLEDLPRYLETLGYVPDLKLAKALFFDKTGYKPASKDAAPDIKAASDAELKKRIDWKNKWGFNDYDLMTLNNFMIETYLEDEKKN